MTPDASLSPEPAADDAAPQLKDLPKDVGVMLVSVGLAGFALPGMAGAPALLAGGLVLWPETFGQVEGWFQRRYPTLHRRSMKQIGRFLNDLDSRYPIHSAAPPNPPDPRTAR